MSLRKFKRSKSKKNSRDLVSQHGSADPGMLLRVAQGYQQAGKVKDAEKVYVQLARAFPGNPAVHNDLGTLFHSQGKLKEALSHYKKAIAIDQNNIQALTNYGLILLDQQDLDEAIHYFQKALSLNPHDAGALTNYGLALHRQGQADKAMEAYQRILKIHPEDVYALNNLAHVFRDAGRLSESVDLYKKISVLCPTSDSWNALGLVYMKQGKFDDALSSFYKALGVEPDHIDSWRNIAIIHIDMQEFEKAIVACKKVVEKVPDDYDLFNRLGILFDKRDDLAESTRYFKEALRIKPDFSAASFCFAGMLEKFNKVEAAYGEVLKGLGFAPHDVDLLSMAARCERRLGYLQKAIGRLSGIDSDHLDTVVRINFHFELARLHDMNGDPDKAYAGFSSANQLSRQYNHSIRKESALDQIDIISEQFGRGISVPPISTSLQGRAPVFLIGFPRSGTTLLDQVLDSHPRIQTMEEKDILVQIENRVADPFERYIEKWQGLTDSEITELQDTYYKEVDSGMTRHEGSILIDRNPYNTIRTAMAWRIFPDTQFILAVRHPLDVCLSCFMQSFLIHNTNANFYTLEDAADLYVKVMSLWRLFLDRLPLNFLLVRYEDMVADLEVESRRILDFLGVEWDADCLQYYEHARARGKIKTASYSQVIQPIYRDAVYRWQRYEKYCEPIKEKLTPYIKYFGY